VSTLRVSYSCTLPVQDLVGLSRVGVLDLSNAAVTNADLVIIAALLAHNDSLKELNLSGNSLGSSTVCRWGIDTGVLALANAIEAHPRLSLEELALWGCGLRSSGFAGKELLRCCAAKSVALSM
jgi:hypothetical protein